MIKFARLEGNGLLPLKAFILPAIFFITTFVRYGAAGHDDEFIFLLSGRSLDKHPWFANVNGDLEDMVSSPLTGLIAALAHWMIPQASLLTFKILGLLAATTVLLQVAIAVIQALGDTNSPRQQLTFSQLAVLTVSLSPVFAFWATGGMETPFQALAFIVFGLGLATQCSEPNSRNGRLTAVAACALVLLRIEGPWVLLVAIFVLAKFRDFSRLYSSDFLVLFAPLLIYAAITFARFQITGAPWPNPVYAKGGNYVDLVPLGLKYIMGFTLSTPLGFLLQTATVVAVPLALRSAKCGFFISTTERPIILAFSSLAVGQDLFTTLAGGNWMSHYRFLAPTLPLKVVLLTWIVGKGYSYFNNSDRPVSRFIIYSFIALAMLQMFQAVRNPNYTENLITPNLIWPILPMAGQKFSLGQLQQQLILANPPHARDEINLRPFVANHLPTLLRSDRPLCIATYQAGYFPWMVRETLGPERIRIADTLGLNDRISSIRPGPRDSLGIVDGFNIDLLIEQREPTLMTLCQGFPDLVYVLNASSSMRERMFALGYKLVWDKPGAVVFGIYDP